MRARRRVVRINPEWVHDAFEISEPDQLIPRLKYCSGGVLLGFDEQGVVRARMRWDGRPFLTTSGPRGGNRREYESPRDMDLLTEVWLITLRWVATGGYDHLPPLLQLAAIEGATEVGA